MRNRKAIMKTTACDPRRMRHLVGIFLRFIVSFFILAQNFSSSSVATGPESVEQQQEWRERMTVLYLVVECTVAEASHRYRGASKSDPKKMVRQTENVLWSF